MANKPSFNPQNPQNPQTPATPPVSPNAPNPQIAPNSPSATPKPATSGAEPFDQPIDPDARTGQEPRDRRNSPTSPAGDVTADQDARTGQESRDRRNTATSPGLTPQTAATGQAGQSQPLGSALGSPAPGGVAGRPGDPASAASAEAKKRQTGHNEDGTPLSVLDTNPDTGNGVQEVCLNGGGAGEGAYYMVGKPIPQDLTVGSDIYNISDRAKGTYTYRVK